MISINDLLGFINHEQRECLADDCEDYLIAKYIPLYSHSYDNIIRQAFEEGYRLHNINI